jgi:hypothetical protein
VKGQLSCSGKCLFISTWSSLQEIFEKGYQLLLFCTPIQYGSGADRTSIPGKAIKPAVMQASRIRHSRSKQDQAVLSTLIRGKDCFK